jgi:putative oxidoreductase
MKQKTKTPITFKGVLIETICVLLVLLFLYASMSKILDLKEFTGNMLNQPFPHWMARIFVWLVPTVELLIVATHVTGLFIEKVRTAALWASLTIMSLFTIYTGTVLLHFFSRVPCSCGGIIRQLSWGQHLLLNLFFVGIATLAIVWRRKRPIQTESIPEPEITLQAANI